MKNFFSIQWLNFKKNWFWYFVWFFIVGFIFPFLFHTIFYLFSFSIGSSDLPVDYLFGFCYWLANCFKIVYLPYVVILLFFILRYLVDIELYIYSYYIYTGNRNWYKFFNERHKLHEKEDSLAYKESLKKIKNNS